MKISNDDGLKVETKERTKKMHVRWAEKLSVELMTPSEFPSGPEEGIVVLPVVLLDKSDFSWFRSNSKFEIFLFLIFRSMDVTYLGFLQ